MSSNSSLIDQIRTLEERLLKSEVRTSPNELSRLLAADFREFGSSGRVYDRQAIIQALQAGLTGQISISDFQVHLLAPQVALATYRAVRSKSAQGEPQCSQRSSIWKFEEGRWQMVFHQGTPILSG